MSSSDPNSTTTKNASTKQRTIQVKIGNGASRTMTPDAAADYLRQVAGKGWGAGRELKMTFDNGSTSTVSLPRSIGTSSSSAADMTMSSSSATRSTTTTRPDGMPCSEKEMKALMSMFVEIMGLQMNTERLNQTYSASTNKNNASSHKNKGGRTKFQFPTDLPPPPGGWPEDLMWPTSPSSIHSENAEEHKQEGDLPGLVEIPPQERARMAQLAAEHRQRAVRPPPSREPIPPVPGSKKVEAPADAPVTGGQGIVPFDWGAIERVAIEDALEQEERIRKDSGKVKPSPNRSNAIKSDKSKTGGTTDPTNTSTAASTAAGATTTATTAQQEAAEALQKVEAANKKLSKAVTVWRTRVAAAVTANDVDKLHSLLEQSPLPAVTNLQAQAACALSKSSSNTAAFHNAAYSGTSYNNNPHLEFLVPLTVPKHRQNNTVGGETRRMLCEYILKDFSATCLFATNRNNGRSAVHTACFYADTAILKKMLEAARGKLTPTQFQQFLVETCQDSGWTPLHYAVASGSLRTLEVVLQAAAAAATTPAAANVVVEQITNDMTTWKKGTNKGVTARYLVQALVAPPAKRDKMVESHGMALQEILQQFKLNKSKNNNSASARTTSLYLLQLQAILKRLNEIETHGYSLLHDKEIARIERDLLKQHEQQQQQRPTKNSLSSSNSSSAEPSVASAPPPPVDESDEDDGEDEEASTTNNNNATTTAKSKKKKKKKKKKAAAAAPPASSLSVSSSKDNVSSSVATAQTEKAGQAVSNNNNTARQQQQQQPPPPDDDPMVTALRGMGFDSGQIAAGIRACGGLSRATADTVVAWIFGGGEEEAAPADPQGASSRRASRSSGGGGGGATSSSRSSSSHKSSSQRGGGGSATNLNMTMEEFERRNLEAARRKEEERLAAEALAAKREEQRRRNREWNKRQASQDSAAAAGGSSQPKVDSKRPPTGLAPASNFLAPNAADTGVRGPSPTTLGATGGLRLLTRPDAAASANNNHHHRSNSKGTSQRQMGKLNFDSTTGVLDPNFSNDTSTVASSSVDHGVIEVRENDDATVSTIGSFPAVQQQQPPPAPAPPGFASGGGGGAAAAQLHPQQQQQQPQWEPAQHRSLSIGDNSNAAYGGGAGQAALGFAPGPPPGIPETGPLLDHHHPHHHDVHGIRSQSFGGFGAAGLGGGGGGGRPSAPPPMPSGSSFLGGGGGGTAFGRSSSGGADAMSGVGGGMGPSLISGAFPNPPAADSRHLERASSAPINHDPSRDLPGLLGLGAAGLATTTTTDSSLVDNISTGRTGAMIGGSSLWGGDAGGAGVGVGGSSLLGSLIHSNSNNNETNPFAKPQQQQQQAQEPSSLFSSAPAFHPASERHKSTTTTNSSHTNNNWMQDHSNSSHHSGGGGGGGGGGIW